MILSSLDDFSAAGIDGEKFQEREQNIVKLYNDIVKVYLQSIFE